MKSFVRKSCLGTVVVAALTGAAVSTVPAVTAKAGASSPGYPSPHLAAPYLQIATSDAGDMAADMKASGVKDYTLAFLTPKSGTCTPIWEDDDQSLTALSPAVASFRAAGGNVIISFGGASGGDIAKTCKSVTALEAAYASVLAAYPGVTRLDFDIEGSTLTSTTGNTRRNQALAELQKALPGTQIDFTLPVNPNGLPSNELNLVKQAKSDGVRLNAVNTMTMDFGNGQNVLADAESAATDTAKQLAAIYTSDSSSQVWDLLGLTPIAGKNDDRETFTQADASSLESFAASHGVQLLAFWEVDGYDKPLGYAYSKVFNKITSP